MGRQSGISQEKLHALADYARSPLFSPIERLCLEYADHMTRTPVAVPDELFAQLRERFTPAQLVELTATLAWENYRARYNHALGIESEDFSEGAACAIPVRSGAAGSHGSDG